jgi:hypothetical protein
MSKHEGLIRLSKVVSYIAASISIAVLLFLLYLNVTSERGGDITSLNLIFLGFALFVYLIGRGIAWIIEGFAS